VLRKKNGEQGDRQGSWLLPLANILHGIPSPFLNSILSEVYRGFNWKSRSLKPSISPFVFLGEGNKTKNISFIIFYVFLELDFFETT